MRAVAAQQEDKIVEIQLKTDTDCRSESSGMVFRRIIPSAEKLAHKLEKLPSLLCFRYRGLDTNFHVTSATLFGR
jgi:hypothetical protein